MLAAHSDKLDEFLASAPDEELKALEQPASTEKHGDLAWAA